MSNCKKRVWKSSPQAAETLEHDLDGNLTMDGVRVPDGQGGYSLDTERVMTWNYDSHLASAWPKWPATGDKLWQYEYDYQGRRVRKYSAAWDQSTNGGYGAYVPPVLEDIRYVYDGWNVILELDGRDLTGGAGGGPDGSPDNVVLRKYAWGLDLSGTMQGAGGIGGLLGVHDVDSTDDFLAYRDANGNVGQLVATDGSVAARYEYDAYGNNQLDPTSIVESGPYAATNPFRFSSKYSDADSKQSSYGYRYLESSLGRWISRDPYTDGELGSTNTTELQAFANSYAFVVNRPTDNVDPDGRIPFPPPRPPPPVLDCGIDIHQSPFCLFVDPGHTWLTWGDGNTGETSECPANYINGVFHKCEKDYINNKWNTRRVFHGHLFERAKTCGTADCADIKDCLLRYAEARDPYFSLWGDERRPKYHCRIFAAEALQQCCLQRTELFFVDALAPIRYCCSKCARGQDPRE